MAQCTAKSKRSGERCKRHAVTGYTVCQVHGAGSPYKGRPGGRPIESGRYGKKLPTRLKDLYDEARQDKDLLALRDEISLTSSMIIDIFQHLDTGESGAAWANAQKCLDDFLQAYAEGERVAEALHNLENAIKKGLDESHTRGEIVALVEQRRKLVESEQKRLVAMQQVISAEKAMLLIGAIIDVIKRNVTDRAQLETISRDIMLLANKQPAANEPALTE